MNDQDAGHILVPVSLNTPSVTAVRRACDLGRGLGSRLTLLHVADPEPAATIDGREFDALHWLHAVTLARPVDHSPVPTLSDTRRPAVLQHRLEQLARAPYTEGVRIETQLRQGLLADEIVSCARERQTRLIVLGARGRFGAWRWLRRDLLQQLVLKVACPIMIVRPSPIP